MKLDAGSQNGDGIRRGLGDGNVETCERDLYLRIRWQGVLKAGSLTLDLPTPESRAFHTTITINISSLSHLGYDALFWIQWRPDFKPRCQCLGCWPPWDSSTVWTGRPEPQRSACFCLPMIVTSSTGVYHHIWLSPWGPHGCAASTPMPSSCLLL